MAIKLSEHIILEFFNYDSKSGDLVINHRRRKWFKHVCSYKAFNSRYGGKALKTKDKDGYIIMTVFGVRILAHRVIWLIMTGNWPKGDIDHINHIRDDNRWCNIREVTRGENLKNLSLRKNSPYKIFGISKIKETGKWRVRISTNQKSSAHVDIFCDFFEACCARLSAENRYNYHANHGARGSL